MFNNLNERLFKPKCQKQPMAGFSGSELGIIFYDSKLSVSLSVYLNSQNVHSHLHHGYGGQAFIQSDLQSFSWSLGVSLQCVYKLFRTFTPTFTIAKAGNALNQSFSPSLIKL